MPQCDPTFAVSQVFWLLITWLLIILCTQKYAWPRFLARQQHRRAELQKWVDKAVTRRAEIAEWQAAYQKALDVAHTAGRNHVHKELDDFEKAADKRREAFANKQQMQAECVAQDTSDVKEALNQWKKECLKILPFS